ncbi:MAG TPA: Crp/Fnr family transcriptional regulator [Firmicutes bacterium]|uniref:Crp/Fnr family transcriptional regulator n=1 Tax=Capillibacterium thermochitinicola TaxID=2699427 RepID=A0A8J6LI03_9FIRM|nr:Crp/Fnr family transcriptional regulator [Capillibacterium thermochitinicola]MBA2132710.1 Crp/Fnr family transcriptional regulator [Capillibacterium thermochitinicola]HHW12713.1 Crp/Fnr family transcriptional regulator [Bacillota bacterium]
MADHCRHEAHASCIERVPIFNSLSEEERREIAAITTARTFKKGDLVYMAGDQAGKLYVLHSGRVKISRINANGKEQVIRVVGPGGFMGELSLFSSLPMTDNGEALEDCTMCLIEGAKLKELMKKYPSIAFKIMEELSRRLEWAEHLIETLNLNTVEQRLARFLLNLAAGKREVVLEMTKGDFASQLGMSQETLSRKLSAFQEKGLIALKGQRGIEILDRDGLEVISAGE